MLYFTGVSALQCHECGSMTDGSTLMGLKGFNNCQFFDHDVAENRSVYLRQCPPDDQCCFTLREHMAVEFWGHQGTYIIKDLVHFVINYSSHVVVNKFYLIFQKPRLKSLLMGAVHH